MPTHNSGSDVPAARKTTNPIAPAEVDPDDQRFAPDPVGEPAGDQRHRDREDDERPVHQPRGGLVEVEDAGQVDEREQVHDPQASPAATQRRGEVEPAQVAVAEDPAERRPDRPAREGRCAVGAASMKGPFGL